MPSLQRQIIQEDFHGGMVRDVAPHLIPPDSALDITNGLINDDGSIYRRGGTTWKSGAAFGSTGLRFIWDGHTIAGRRTLFANPSDFGVLAADDSTVVNLGEAGLSLPKPTAYIEDMLFIGGGFIYGGSRKASNFTCTGSNTTVTQGSKIVTDPSGGFTANVDPGMLMQVASSERVYVVASVDSDTQVTLRDNYEGATSTTANPTFYKLYPIAAADPYEAADLYMVVSNRLVFATGNTVQFSEVQKPHDFTNQFATLNVHEVPEGLAVTGLASVGGIVLIFTTGGLWTLQGLALDIVDEDGNPNHRLTALSRDLVLWGQGGLASYKQLVIAPCANGVYLLDGVSAPVLLSQAITPLYEFLVAGPYRPGGAVTFSNHYLLPVLDGNGKVKELFVCRLSRLDRDHSRANTFAWTRLKGQGSQIAAFAIRAEAPAGALTPSLLGAETATSSRVAICTSYFKPTATTKNDADGSTHAMTVVTRDYETGGLTLNAVRRMRARYELIDAGSDNPTLTFSWGDGSSAGLNNWGEVDWNEFNWNAGGSTFYTLTPDAPEDNGMNPHSCRINKRRRFVRLRAINNDPAASYVLRSFELFVRPSDATRK